MQENYDAMRRVEMMERHGYYPNITAAWRAAVALLGHSPHGSLLTELVKLKSRRNVMLGRRAILGYLVGDYTWWCPDDIAQIADHLGKAMRSQGYHEMYIDYGTGDYSGLSMAPSSVPLEFQLFSKHAIGSTIIKYTRVEGDAYQLDVAVEIGHTQYCPGSCEDSWGEWCPACVGNYDGDDYQDCEVFEGAYRYVLDHSFRYDVSQEMSGFEHLVSVTLEQWLGKNSDDTEADDDGDNC